MKMCGTIEIFNKCVCNLGKYFFSFFFFFFARMRAILGKTSQIAHSPWILEKTSQSVIIVSPIPGTAGNNRKNLTKRAPSPGPGNPGKNLTN